ncbi:hypothetical protein ALNOE001_02870 [Candidatus Methanobinarius endosymbioticus]|uniref:ABC-2 type transporter domain-containing protein n=1 Tax=Candidatus Methanobinarius endosymbioticus TaxID=2006182 RepID=A0A366MFS8_9EURY|nr:hypothetical protein ALNOE001_02870 [Candidatus Methanobinarius endosymbioticus]
MLVLAGIYHFSFGIVGFTSTIAIEFLIKMIIGGILMFLIISPFFSISVLTKGIITPIIAATIFVMGNVGLVNESIGALYPWTSIYLLLNGGTYQTGYSCLLYISLILIVSIIGFIASILYFKNKDIN